MAAQNQAATPRPWWDEYGVTQSFGSNGEHGVDIGTPYQTPLTAPLAGVVTQSGYHAWGGEVDIATTLPDGRAATEYLMHLSRISPGIVPGARVSLGDVVGLSGGQIGYGEHPTGAPYSTGPHTEVGFNVGGSYVNPRPILNAADQGYGSRSTARPSRLADLFASLGGNVPGGLPSILGGATLGASTAGVQAVQQDAQQAGAGWFQPVADWLDSLKYDAAYVGIGALLLVIGLLVFFFAGRVAGQSPARHAAGFALSAAKAAT